MGLWEVTREDLQKWDILSPYSDTFADVRLVCFPYRSNESSPFWALVVTTRDKVYAVGGVPAWALHKETPGSSDPVEIAALSGKGVKDLAYGEKHCLALTDSGKVMSWGENSSGQLGLGSTESSKVPVELPGLPQVTAVACGKIYSLVLTKNEVYAWGSSNHGQCGLVDDKVLTPRRVVFPAGITLTSIACGTVHAAALGSDGKVYCWGRNDWGQLGRGSADLDSLSEPRPVESLSGVSQVCCSGRSTLALVMDGQLWAWGNNKEGRLKVHSADSSVKIPLQVTFLTGVSDITSFWGKSPFLARTKSAVFAWRHRGDEMDYSSSLAGVLANRPTPTLIVKDGPPAKK